MAKRGTYPNPGIRQWLHESATSDTWEQRQAHRRKATVDASLERGDDVGVKIALKHYGVDQAYYYAMTPQDYRDEAADFIDEQELDMAEERSYDSELDDLRAIAGGR